MGPEANKTIGGYTLVREIGRGGMGVVYEARQAMLERPVAIKVISSKYSSDPEFMDRFEREARITASIDHPNVVRVFDFDREGSRCYLVMEYLDGMTLSELLAKRYSLDLKRSLHLLREIAQGLGAAHAKGVLHRDIKPHNIMLDRHGNVKVMDFGLSKPFDATTQMTEAGALLGTPTYMAPEQCRAQPVTFQTDIYSLGVVLFEMLTGRAPFEADSPLALMLRIVQEPFPAPTSVVASLPDSVDTLVGNMVAKDPSSRYDSVESLIRDVTALQLDANSHLPATEIFSKLVAPLEDPGDAPDVPFALDNAIIDDLVSAAGPSFAPPVVTASRQVPVVAWALILSAVLLAVVILLPGWLQNYTLGTPPEPKFTVVADDLIGESGKRYVYTLDDGESVGLEWVEEFQQNGETFHPVKIPIYFFIAPAKFFVLDFVKSYDAVYAYWAAGDDYPYMFFSTPLEDGKTWEARCYNSIPDQIRGVAVTHYYRCDEVSVTVPSGTFRAMRIVDSLNNPPDFLDPTASVSWYAPGWGLIKFRITGQAGQKDTLSLMHVEDI